MSNTNYGEVLCQAVDEIVRKRLEGVSYDQTILCTIVNDEKRKEGLYVVSNNNSVKFEAYSNNTDYHTNDNVYVQIPGGDWNQQKTIVSKKTNKTDKPFIYKNPFDALVDITGNVIDKGISTPAGLLANGSTDKVVLWTYNYKEDELNQIGVENKINQTGESLMAYTRLGIQAGFKSLLNPFYVDEEVYNVNQGDYGLRLVIDAETPDTANGDAKTAEYEIYLNCMDMNGNPYDFQTFYTQEKVIDISTVGKITKMRLEFYQQAGSFVSAEGVPSPSLDFFGNLLEPNLFVNDVYISLGYDAGDFEDEEVLVYTLGPTTYSRNSDELKDVYLRWIHKLDDGTFKSIGPNEEMEFEVRWYKFELGHSSADEYSGVYWKNWSKQEHYYNAETDKWDSNYEILDDEYIASTEEDKDPTFFHTKFITNASVQNEQIKAIILYNGKPYRSNILRFENENEVVNKATIDAIQALSIQCDDNTYGNYRIYGQNGQLLDQADARKPRTWVPYFRSAAAGEDVAPTELFEAEEVEWIIPTKNTMLKVDVSGFNEDDISYEGNNDERIHIKLYPDNDPNTKDFPLSYTINSYYSQNYSDNTIQCKIVKNGITYTAVKEHTFGPSGTMGSDCTFVLDFEGNAAALTVGDTKTAVIVVAKLYDYENNEVEITAENEIDWDWKTSDENIELIENGIRAELKLNANSITTNYNILQASIKWGDGSLTAYLPIPIRTSTDYAYISGATQVIYDSDGNISNLYANPYILYETDATEASASWSIENDNSDEENYSPSIITDTKGEQYLKPLNFYVKNACEKVCVIASVGGTAVWLQPLLIMQNRYPSAMINQWDGNLKVDEEGGTIMTPRLVAGKKNSDSTFTGVMMGDWGKTNSDNSITSTVGLYGFSSGEQSFAFKEDGTAFIGKSGGGRIEFDGTNSTIQSSGYSAGSGLKIDLNNGLLDFNAKVGGKISFSDKEAIIQSGTYSSGQGMKIDLYNGIIDAHSFTLSAGRNNDYTWFNPTQGADRTIFINTNAKDYPLRVGSNFYVDWNGNVVVNSGTFKGTIKADNGYIAGFTIEKTTIQSREISRIFNNQNTYNGVSGNPYSEGIYIGTDGIGLGNGAFYVDSLGHIYIQNGGKIADFLIDETSLYYQQMAYNYQRGQNEPIGSEGVYIGSDGIGLGWGAFSVSNKGDMILKKSLTAGNFIINDNDIYHVSGGGSISVNSLSVNSISLNGYSLSVSSVSFPRYTISERPVTLYGSAYIDPETGQGMCTISATEYSIQEGSTSFNCIVGSK